MSRLLEQTFVKKEFNYFITGQVFSQIGENMSKVSLAWLVFSLAGSQGAVSGISLLVILQALPPLLFGWLYGHMIDSFGSKRSMLFYADISRGAIFCLIPVFFFFHLLSLPLLYLFVFGAAVFSGLFGPAMFATIPEFDGAGTLVRRNTMINVTGHIGILVGPLIGGLLSFYFKPGLVVFVTGLAFLISGFFIYKIKDVSFFTKGAFSDFFLRPIVLLKKAFTFHGVQENILSNVFYAATFSKPSRLFCLMSFFVGVVLGPITSLVPVYAKNVLHGGPETLGTLLTASGAGMLISSLLLSRSRRQFGSFYNNHNSFSWNEIFLTGTLFLSGMVLMPTALTTNLIIASAILFLGSGLADLFNPIMQTELQTMVPSDKLGKVLTSIGSFFLIGIILGTLVTPLCVKIIGVANTFVLVGLLRVLTAMIPLFLRNAKDYLPVFNK